MGKPMRIRAKAEGGKTNVRVLMSHPMEGGQRKDGSGNLIPAHFISDVEAKHGGKTVTLARFLPILRTFAPFVAGIARMHYGRFQTYNFLGAVSWVSVFLGGGYLFGNIPWVRDNFGLVTLMIVFGSLLPVGFVALRERLRR